VGPDVRDERVMRRFLVGDVTPDEHDAVDDACAEDSEYFEALCALEEELLVLHLRGELPADVRNRFIETLPDYPARQRRLDELAALRSVIAEEARLVAANGDHRAPVPSAPVPSAPVLAPARPSSTRYLPLAAAAGFVLVAAVGIWWSMSQRHPSDTFPPPITTTRKSTTFMLALGQNRSDASQQNVFGVPRDVDDVDLEATVRPSAGATLSATLQRVGGEPIPMAGAPHDLRTRDGASVARWRLPGSALGVGDYVLTIAEERSAGERDTLARAFFSIVER
jgi:hypothetical protein